MATPRAIPSPDSASQFPLAVVTGYTDLRQSVSLADLEREAASGALLVPCGLAELRPLALPTDCSEVDDIVIALGPDFDGLALLPPGLVDPTMKVLDVEGADLFGGPTVRVLPYPITAMSDSLSDEWMAYDTGEIRTVMSTGESCADRGVAYAAITEGRGWDWVFGGGSAEYSRIFPNPVPAGQVGNGFDIFDAMRTGNEGAVAKLVSGADVTVAGYECPVHEGFSIAAGTVFGTDPAIPPLLAETFGVDAVTLGANHITDQGVAGLEETLRHFDAAGIARTGAGMNLDEALQPAIVEAAGVSFAFVGMNVVPGAFEAGPEQPGAVYITPEYAQMAVARAREDGADLVLCLPEWGWPEYHADMSEDQRRLQAVLLEAGCDHILGRGTHWAGELDFGRNASGDVRITVGSHGNFIFGQGWSQETSEGVFVELAFAGSRLVQARLHPYAILDQAQPNLTDPAGDGRHVLERVYAATDFTVPEKPLSESIGPAGSGAPAPPLPPCEIGDEATRFTDYADWDQTLLDTNLTLPADYEPPDLVPVTEAGIGAGDDFFAPGMPARLRDFVIPDLAAMAEAARADGVTLYALSAYRSYETQRRWFENYVATVSEEGALMYSNRPGHSEHQLGTTMDFAVDDGGLISDWLLEHAWRFGFVQSYPEGKHAIACIAPESWHFRYMGRQAARHITDSGLTIREVLWPVQHVDG